MAIYNAKKLAVSYAAATITSIGLGYAGAWLYDQFAYGGGMPATGYWILIDSTWVFIAGLPSAIAARNMLTEALGQRKPVEIRAAAIPQTGRRVRINYSSGARDIFMSVLPAFRKDATPQPRIDNQIVFEVNAPSGFGIVQLDGDFAQSFLRSAWRRQRNGKPGLSERYWTRQRRGGDRIDRDTKYKPMMNLLIGAYEVAQVQLVTNVGPRLTAKLTQPPARSFDILKHIYLGI